MVEYRAEELQFFYALARDLGIPVVRTEPGSWVTKGDDTWDELGVTWTGRILHLDPMRVAGVGLVHELAHWFAARGEERFQPNWGLDSMDDETADLRERESDMIEKVLEAAARTSASRNVEVVKRLADESRRTYVHRE